MPVVRLGPDAPVFTRAGVVIYAKTLSRRPVHVTLGSLGGTNDEVYAIGRRAFRNAVWYGHIYLQLCQVDPRVLYIYAGADCFSIEQCEYAQAVR